MDLSIERRLLSLSIGQNATNTPEQYGYDVSCTALRRFFSTVEISFVFFSAAAAEQEISAMNARQLNFFFWGGAQRSVAALLISRLYVMCL